MATADPMLAWLKEALGVELEGEAGAGQKKESGEQKAGTGQQKDAKGPLFGKIGDAIGDAIDRVGEVVGDLGDKIYPPETKEVQKRLDQDVKGLDALGLDTKRLKGDQAEQERALADAAKVPDKGQREAAITRARKRMQELQKHAEALASAAKKVMGDAKGAPNEAQKAAIYKNALEDHYGLEVTIPAGMTNTHMDRVYDMMGTVPKKQAKHRKLKKLTYSSAADDAGSGAYGDAEIEMGDFGDATGSEDYQIDGEKVPANSFDVTTLHEMGHALDDKQGIMAKHMAKSGCGGWRSESKDSVADALLAFFRSKVTVGKEITDKAVRDAILAALSGTTPTAPAGAKDSDWQQVTGFLADYAAKVIGSYKPWFKAAVDIGGRAYIQSYKTRWNSYEIAAREPTKVNDYQWRAPGEWFAEVYAISWLSKKKPPKAVDDAVAEHCWRG
jgi:hypothetical protein